MRNHRVVTGGKLDPFPFRIRAKLGLAFGERRVMGRRALDIGPRNLLPVVFVVLQRGDPGSVGVRRHSPHYLSCIGASKTPVCGKRIRGHQGVDTVDLDDGLSQLLLYRHGERAHRGFSDIWYACVQVHERPYPRRHPSGNACDRNASEAVSHQDDVIELFVEVGAGRQKGRPNSGCRCA